MKQLVYFVLLSSLVYGCGCCKKDKDDNSSKNGSKNKTEQTK